MGRKYEKERADPNRPLTELNITTRVPEKWRIVDLETGQIYRSVGSGKEMKWVSADDISVVDPAAEAEFREERSLERLNALLSREKRKGNNQQQVAAASGLTSQYLSDIKLRRRPLTELAARRIADAHGISHRWLLGHPVRETKGKHGEKENGDSR